MEFQARETYWESTNESRSLEPSPLKQIRLLRLSERGIAICRTTFRMQLREGW